MMRFSAFIVILVSFTHVGFAQIMIGPLTVGEYYNEVVYQGSYDSPGNCTWADGIDFNFDFNGLTEVDGMEYVLIIDEPDPDSTFMMNGWLPVYVGDSTVFTPSTSGLGISAASGPAELNFHIRLIGTPTTVGQTYPCWVDGASTDALCGNVWSLFIGEAPIACTVQTSTDLKEQPSGFSISQMDGKLIVNGSEAGQLSLFSIDGKLIQQSAVSQGISRIDLPGKQGVILVQIQTGNELFSTKILLN